MPILDISLQNNANDSGNNDFEEDSNKNNSDSSKSLAGKSDYSLDVCKNTINEEKSSQEVNQFVDDLEVKVNSKFESNENIKKNLMEFDVDDKLTQFNNRISLNKFDYLMENKNNKNEIFIGDNNNDSLVDDLKKFKELNYNNKQIDISDDKNTIQDLKENSTKIKLNLINQLEDSYFILSNHNVSQINYGNENYEINNSNLLYQKRMNRTSIINHIQKTN